MATKILIPTPLRPFTDKKDAVEVDGTTVGELLADLTTRARGPRRRISTTTEGKLRSFVNIYVNDEDIRYLQKEQTPVKAGRHREHHPVGRGRRPASGRAPAALPELTKRRIQALQPPPDPAGGRRRRVSAS